MTKGQSPRQTASRDAQKDKAIAFIREKVEANGFPPTTHELMAHLGYRSTASVHVLLSQLQAEGRITRHPHRPRTIQVIDGG